MITATKKWVFSQSPRFLGTATGLASIIVGASFYLYETSLHYVSTDNAYVETDMSPVTSRMMGYVREVFVQENDVVKKGQQLVKLDDVDTRLELGFKQAKLKKAQADMNRAQTLETSHALSEADFELAQAQLTGSNADVEGSLLKLKFTDVVSPVDGVVAKRSAQPGQFVQPGQTLIVVVPIDHAWIKANFKENQIRLVKVGQSVEIHADAYPDLTWEGRIEYIYPSSVASMSLLPPENATGNFTKVIQRFPVKISFKEDPEHPLRPGMSVEPTVKVR